MGRPRVSVIVINYNYGRYLSRAVSSVLAQEVPAGGMEILVVDDGSTDDSKDRISPYLEKVRWIEKRNGGQVSAFNTGMREAKGEFVALLESDDFWESTKLAQCLARLTAQPEAAMVQHWLTQADADGNSLPGFSYPDGPTQVDLDVYLRRSLPYIGASCVVFRRAALEKHLPLPEKFLYGADACLRLLAATKGPILVIPKRLGTRRLHGKNLFGGTVYDDRDKLERTLKFHWDMASYHRRVLDEAGKKAPPGALEELEFEGRVMEMFLNRYRWKFPAAIASWAKAVAVCRPFAFSVFKGAALFIALLAPRAYLRLQGAYARSPLHAWRRKRISAWRA
ncbi:MAG: glycosyltransferase [Elusimicrobiota bacterium]